MIDKVSVDRTTFAALPARLEAGTPPIVEAVGLATALRYVKAIGWSKIEKHEKELFAYLIKNLMNIPDIVFLGNPALKQSLVSFYIKGIHPDDLSMILSKENVCVRVGHHCAMPLHTRFGIKASLRVSLGLYNDKADVDAFIKAMKKAIGFFK